MRVPRFILPLLYVVSLFSVFATPGWAATQQVDGNPLQIIMLDDGSPTINVWGRNPDNGSYEYTAQYCCGTTNTDWGSIIWLNGSDQGAEYLMNGSIAGYFGPSVTPVSNDMVVTGPSPTITTITTVVDLGSSGVQVTQIFTYIDGNRYVTKEWRIHNGGATTYPDVRFFHGGDTMFGGVDSAYGFYDAINSMVYVRNNDYTNWGLMGFYANPATPATGYFEGNYWDGNTLAGQDAALSNSVVSSFIDAGYYLQWNRASLAPGDTWTIQAYENWTDGGGLQVLAPANQNVSADTTADLSFTVQNLTEDEVPATLTASDTAGWGATIISGSTITIPANGSSSVTVRVTIPGSATAGQTSTVTLTADDGGTPKSASAVLTVVSIDMTVSPDPVAFGDHDVGSTTNLTVTISNTGVSSLKFGTLGGSKALSAPFSKSADTCTGATIVSSGTCSFVVTYHPTTGGTYNDSMNIPVLEPLIASRTLSASGSAGVPTFSITTSPDSNGTLSCSPNPVAQNSTTSCTATATTAGYHVSSVSGCGITYSNTSNGVTSIVRTTGSITGACTVSAAFAVNVYAIDFANGGNGSLSGNTSQTVNYGASATAVTAVPAAGYHFVNWTGNNGFVTTTSNPLIVSNVTAAQTITANFAVDTYSVAFVSGGNGSITGSTSQTVNYGGAATAVTAVPAAGYHFVNWTGDNGFVTTTSNPLTVSNVTASQTIMAHFASDSAAVLPDGDINMDGVVDVADALLALRAAIGVQSVSSAQKSHGDVAPLSSGVPHPDEVIDIGDVVVILRKAVGLVNW
jgi:uncharacterized repeat protein (TIGR02543 family)